MKVIDCFTFFDEEIVLDLRLNILHPYVDKFIITEGKYDHRGNSRDLVFNKNKFKNFEDKIEYIIVDDYPDLKDPWSMLRHQRNIITKFLNRYEDNDFIMISDVDEIPNPIAIKKFLNKKKKIGIFKQLMFYYKLNLINNTCNYWHGTKICKKKFLNSPEGLRALKPKIYPWWRLDKERSIEILDYGGWHFSFLYDAIGISKKLSSYQHTEFDIPSINDLDTIKDKLNNNLDIFGRDYSYKKITIDDSFPKYLFDNKEKYKEWIKN